LKYPVAYMLPLESNATPWPASLAVLPKLFDHGLLEGVGAGVGVGDAMGVGVGVGVGVDSDSVVAEATFE
jgi:hypothetical protein